MMFALPSEEYTVDPIVKRDQQAVDGTLTTSKTAPRRRFVWWALPS